MNSYCPAIQKLNCFPDSNLHTLRFQEYVFHGTHASCTKQAHAMQVNLGTTQLSFNIVTSNFKTIYLSIRIILKPVEVMKESTGVNQLRSNAGALSHAHRYTASVRVLTSNVLTGELDETGIHTIFVVRSWLLVGLLVGKLAWY